jgi:hypothetical protein
MNKADLLAKIIYLMDKGRQAQNQDIVPLLHCLNIIQGAAKINMEEPLASYMAQFVKLLDHIEPRAIEEAKRQLAGEKRVVDPVTGRELEKTESGLLLIKS